MSKELRVLLVEDSEDDALLMLHALRKGGLDPRMERVDSPEAMRAALERQEWDIVLCDYVMPEFNGPAALKLLQDEGIDLPFIVVSGQVGEDAAVGMMKAGAHDYIMKGNLARLIPAVERELEEAQVRRARRRAEEERDRLVIQLRKVNEQAVINSVRRAEQASEMEAIIAGLAEAVVVYGPDGKILRMNPAAADLLGLPSTAPEPSLTPLWAELRPETDGGRALPAEEAPHLRALRGEVVRGVVVLLHRTSDRSALWVSVSAAPLPTPEDKPRGAVIIFTDVTALRAQ